MSGNQPSERLTHWLEQLDHSQLLDPASDSVDATSIDTNSIRKERPQNFDKERNGPSPSNDSAHQDYWSYDEIPQEIPLPDSHASSSVTETPIMDQNALSDSLEDILRNIDPVKSPSTSLSDYVSLSDYNSHSEVSTEEMPSHRVGSSARRQTPEPRHRARQPYGQTLENAKVLEHIRLGNVCKRSRHNKTHLVYYDYFNGLISSATEIYNAKQIAYLSKPPQNVQQRLLVVEDLSKRTILALGQTFCINPEFFEEHLINSGYAGGEYDMLPAKMWPTASLKKSYISTKWIRPVSRLPMYSWNYTMQDLATNSLPGTENREENIDKDETPKGHIKHITPNGVVTTRAYTNIFRSEWHLWDSSQRAGNVRRDCGLEERITVWKGTLPGRACEFVIVLVDPLPMVEEKHPGPIAQDYQEHRFKADDYSEFSEVNTDSAERGIARRVYDLRYPTGANEPLLMKWGRAIKKRMKRRMRRDSDWITVSSMPEEVSLHKVIITQIAPRHTIDIDLDQAFQSQELTMSFDREINSTKSTLDGVCDKLERDGRPFNLSRSLFHIIRQDTLTLLKQLSHSLEEVEIGLLDDSKMEDQLSVWIQAIGCAQREISELQASVEPFIVFCISLDLPLNTGEENAVFRSELTCDLQKFSENITQMSDRLQRTSMLLTSNMGLLDSRRSISEAQAVSRLTELAFVFVPLSFATSVFGMQVKPLADPVPLRSFFIVAIVVTTFAYLMRATMRSQWLGYLKTLMRHDVRRYAKSHSLPVPTQSMPTLLTVQWIGSWLGVGIKAAIGSMRSTAVAVWSLCKEVWEVFGFVILFILLNGSISGLLIAILWAQRLDPSTRYAVSIAIIMIVIVGVGIPFWYWSDPDFRHALPNWIHDKMRFYQPSSNLRMVLTSSLIVVLMMIPLILIWMRPLANDIKSGLTAGILMSAISIMCLLICWWFKVDFPLAVSARMSRS